MAVKATMIFSVERASPTETHYSRVYDDPTSEAAVDAALKLVAVRVGLLGLGANMLALRLSRSDVPRTVVNPDLTGVKTGFGDAQPGNEAGNADIANVSALLRASDLAGHSKAIYLCGLPSGCVDIVQQQPLAFAFSGKMAPAFTAYKNELLANWKFRIKAPLASSLVLTALNTTVPQPDITVYTTAPIVGQPAQPPFEVNLSGFRRSNTRTPGLSGIYQVIAIQPIGPGQPLQGYTLGETANVLATNLIRMGTIAVNNFAFAPYNALIVVKSGTRKRGGSAAAPRGRSRPRA